MTDKRAAGAPGVDLARFFLVGMLAYALAHFALRALQTQFEVLNQLFPHFLVLVTLVKLSADLVYFGLSPKRREWGQIDDYLLNDLVTFYRFGFPLAIVQTYAMVKGYVAPGLIGVWIGPAPALVLVLINRWLIEKAQEDRSRARKKVPTLRGPEG